MKRKIGVNIYTSTYTKPTCILDLSKLLQKANYRLLYLKPNYLLCSKWDLSVKIWRNGDFILYLDENIEDTLNYSLLFNRITEIQSIFKIITPSIEYKNYIIFNFYNFKDSKISGFEDILLKICSNVMQTPKIQVINNSDYFKAIKIQNSSIFC